MLVKSDPTPLIRPNVHGPLVIVLTGFHCTKNLKTAYECLEDKYNIPMTKHSFSTLMLSKTNVTFSSNTSCQGYIAADIIMVLSHLKEQMKRIKVGRVN